MLPVYGAISNGQMLIFFPPHVVMYMHMGNPIPPKLVQKFIYKSNCICMPDVKGKTNVVAPDSVEHLLHFIGIFTKDL